MFVTIFGPDLESDGVESGLYLPLKDEEGVLGVLVFESATADFATPTQREVAAILANQTAVALRNAQLYHQVPMVDALGALAAKRQALRAMPRGRLQIYAGIAAAGARRAGPDPLAAPGRRARTPRSGRVGFAPVRALVAGVVERIPVSEGSPVARGTPVAYLRATSLRADREATAAEAASADRLASLAASRGDAVGGAAAPAPRGRAAPRGGAARRGARAHHLRAPVRGIVLTPRVEERVGSSLEEGDQLLTLGRTDSLELEFGVAQRDIGRVRPGQEVRLRVDAVPQRTFVGARAAPWRRCRPTARARSVTRSARSSPIPTALLRPSMAAYVRVLTDPASAATRLFRGPGPLGAPPLVEDLVVTRPSPSPLAVLLAACGGDGAGAPVETGRGRRLPLRPAPS